MIKQFLFSTLFMIIGYCSYGQSGQYIAILEDGWCVDNITGTISWYQNPKIIVIDPNGTITETPLTAANSMQDVIEHTAEFNVTVSQIMNLGYTINSSDNFMTASVYAAAYLAASSFQWPDAQCTGGNNTSSHTASIVSLIPCCTPPWTDGVDVLSENNPFLISNVFPNPSNDLIHLEVKFAVGQTPESVLVYDVMGNVLLNTPYSNSSDYDIELDISKLSSGLYFVKLSGDILESKPKPFSVY